MARRPGVFEASRANAQVSTGCGGGPGKQKFREMARSYQQGFAEPNAKKSKSAVRIAR